MNVSLTSFERDATGVKVHLHRRDGSEPSLRVA
jgi:hypothetical protein